MGAPPAAHPVYRFRQVRRDDPARDYRFTLEVVHEVSAAIVARCDVMGRVAFATHVIHDDIGRAWRLAPNRSVMPTRWLLTDPAGTLALQFDQHLAGKLLNPFQRTGLMLRDAKGGARFRLVDARKGMIERIVGPGPSDWALLRDEMPVATLTRLPPSPAAPSGWRDRMAGWLADRDLVLISLVAPPPLAPTEGLALALLIGALNAAAVA